MRRRKPTAPLAGEGGLALGLALGLVLALALVPPPALAQNETQSESPAASPAESGDGTNTASGLLLDSSAFGAAGGDAFGSTGFASEAPTEEAAPASSDAADSGATQGTGDGASDGTTEDTNRDSGLLLDSAAFGAAGGDAFGSTGFALDGAADDDANPDNFPSAQPAQAPPKDLTGRVIEGVTGQDAGAGVGYGLQFDASDFEASSFGATGFAPSDGPVAETVDTFELQTASAPGASDDDFIPVEEREFARDALFPTDSYRAPDGEQARRGFGLGSQGLPLPRPNPFPTLTAQARATGAPEQPSRIDTWLEVPPQDVGNVVVLGADGTPIALSSFRGVALVVNFWASWCAPCVEELPTLIRLQEQLNDLANNAAAGDRVRLVLISLDAGGLSTATRFLASLGIDTPTLADPQLRTRRQLGFGGLPYTMLVDAQGRMVAERLGPARWDADGVAEETFWRLGKKPLARFVPR